MPSEKEDEFQPILDKVLKANYNAKMRQYWEERPDDPVRSPFRFYDRHISSSDSLRNIVPLPSIPHLLSKTCDSAIEDFKAKGHKFPPNEHDLNIPSVKFTDSASVGKHYLWYIGSLCIAYLSKLQIHPHTESWRSVFTFNWHLDTDTFYASKIYLTVTLDAEARAVNLNDEIKGKLSQPTLDNLTALLFKMPKMTAWHMFPMLDTFTTIFHNVTKYVGSLSWPISRTTGYRFTARTTPPPDSKILTNMLPVPGTYRRAKSQLAGEPASYRQRVEKYSKTISVPYSTQRTQYRPDFRHYLQHAWADAVMHDITFIVLHCGRYERIGIRHRASQTLYLSGVIDTVNIKDPHYRKIHIGLYIATLQDALERMKLRNSADDKVDIKGKKRSSVNVDDAESSRPKKRRRTSSSPASTDIGKYLIDRKLALVSLDYGPFSSSVPSSFVRIGESCKRKHSREATDWVKDPTKQRKYAAHEYFTLTLLAPLGDGSVGVSHPAQAEVILESGEVITETLVLKLAFNEKTQKRMRHEFAIYCRMSRAGVEGIVDVHGLFFDAESNTLGLLMAHGGETLRNRDIARTGIYGDKISGTVAEKKAFEDIIRNINEADISHHDIRPENMTIRSDGKAFLIDFDSALYHSPFWSVEDQLENLDNIFHKPLL
uniref:Protein kinase domain-containing protein n=1 Tax=Psilocybe cubensis TaxID=181762 RepID=A0A8H7Y6M2_PSICU